MTPVCELYRGKSAIAHAVYRILTHMKDKSLESSKPDLNILFICNITFRGIAKMHGGAVSMKMVDGLLLIVNGHFFKGIGKFLGGFVENKKQPDSMKPPFTQSTKSRGKNYEFNTQCMEKFQRQASCSHAVFILLRHFKRCYTLQLVLMPLFKWMFDMTGLVGVNFQIGNVGTNFDGTPYFIFNYAAGKLGVNGGGGGLAYFLAVQITITIAQIVNFFLQRNITFKSNSSIAKAAFWYIVAYLIITIGAAALQGLYKAPIYNLFINTFAMGHFGETIADVIVMLINCTISFWVFFPIFKFIFKKEPESNS